MAYQKLIKGNISWNWKEFGSGKKLLLAFHGFNRSPDDFEPFSKWLGQRYKILAFDLFFHGESFAETGDKNTPLTLQELRNLLDYVLTQYKASEFEVLAYSFGGRLALNCVEIYPDKIKGLYLMAPDGLHFNKGFWFAARTFPGRYLMKKFVSNVNPLINLMSLIGNIKLYNLRTLEFYKNYILMESMRKKVFHSWMFHRSTVPDLNKIIKIIQQQNIRLLLFFGKHDIIIPPRIGKQFAARAGIQNSFHLLETGHRLLEKHREISRIILSDS